MKRLHARVPVVVILGFLAGSAAALARGAQLGLGQRLAGRWPPNARVEVWVAPSLVRKDDPAFVERAMRVWTQAAAGRFTLERTTGEAASAIRIRFGNGQDLLGETVPTVDPRTGFITHAEIAIAANLPGDHLGQQIVIYMTALHELGHAIGLRHSNEFDDIMYFFRRPDDPDRYFGAYRRRIRSADDIGSVRATGLSPRDLDALRALYE